MQTINRLTFTVTDDGATPAWGAAGTPLCATPGGDFWRMMLDDGYMREMTIHSADQSGRVERADGVTTITYDRLVGEDGRVFDATLVLRVTDTGADLRFDATLTNRSEARLNELQYPYIDLACACDTDRSRDVLVRPNGFGERMPDPWTALERAHTEYMSADYHEIKSTLKYPSPATMSWMGLETGGNFLYLGRHDPDCRVFCLLSAIAPREATEPRLVSAICQYPFVTKGETLSVATVVAGLFAGDWRVGSDIYGAFARATFYQTVTPPEWVKQMRGWQRIILRHQYGEIFWKYEDLPRLYREGKAAGLDTLLVFGWWKGRFDNGYPHYEVDEELGGEEALRDAIAEVKRMGGNVILYNNGILIDKKTDFYREYGHEIATIDIDGNEYEDHYKFENDGTVLRNFGYKSFVHACQSEQLWQDVMVNNARLKLKFNPSSIFYDQLGGRSKLCFNSAHAHGLRVDEQFKYRRKNIAACRALLGPDQAIGTEVVIDCIAAAVDYTHGCNPGAWYHNEVSSDPSNFCPAIFRRTFPEAIISNRRIHDCRRGWRDDLSHAFLHGLRLDIAIFRCRKVGIAGMPEQAAYVKEIIALKDQYADFFYGDGRYLGFPDETLPEGLRAVAYSDGGDRRIWALWNTGKTAVTCRGVTVEAGGIGVVEITQD